MSRGVTVYSVSAHLSHAIGSRDESIKNRLRAEDPQQLAAARQLVDGVTPSSDPATVIHAFEIICQTMGRLVPSNSLSPLPADFLEIVDRELAQRRLPFTVSQLIMGGGPLRLPWAADFPTVGHVEAGVVQAAAQQLNAQPLTSENADIEGVIVDVGDWLEVAAPRGDMLVGFWY